MRKMFHEGELAVQRRAGVLGHAHKVGRIIADRLPDGAHDYLGGLPILFIGAVDEDGQVWASALAGDAGFIRVDDRRTVLIRADQYAGDPLAGVSGGSAAGFLAIDLSTRQRFRFNGRVSRVGGVLRVRVEQAYGNCPKYIQLRNAAAAEDVVPGPAVVDSGLSLADVELIREADTFFIASVAEGHGADVSHRGGEPGFVRVGLDGAIRFRDYPGNNMFQTLGNLTADPRAGLLFIDFETGSTLQLTGRAEVRWASVVGADPADTGRSAVFRPDRVVRTARALPLRWEPGAASPFNPSEKSR